MDVSRFALGRMSDREISYLCFSNDDSVLWNRFHRIRVNYATISGLKLCLFSSQSRLNSFWQRNLNSTNKTEPIPDSLTEDGLKHGRKCMIYDKAKNRHK